MPVGFSTLLLFPACIGIITHHTGEKATHAFRRSLDDRLTVPDADELHAGIELLNEAQKGATKLILVDLETGPSCPESRPSHNVIARKERLPLRPIED